MASNVIFIYESESRSVILTFKMLSFLLSQKPLTNTSPLSSDLFMMTSYERSGWTVSSTMSPIKSSGRMIGGSCDL